MKTAIIILTILALLFKGLTKGCENYIRNDHMEALKYKYTNGATKAGLLFAIFSLGYYISICADIVCLVVLLLGKI